MNKILGKIVVLIACISMLMMLSCQNDNKIQNDGFFTVNNKKYYLNRATLQNVGQEEEFYQLRLSLDNTSNNYNHRLNFLVFSEVADYLPSAKYVPYLYDGEYLNTFKRGAWMLGDVEMGVFLTGQMKSTKTNDIYTIHINCKDLNGNTIVGEYKGKIQVKK